MGLFDFFKKNDEEKKQEDTKTEAKASAGKKQKLTSPVDGKVIAIDEIEDPVFSEKMMGDGFGVVPKDKHIYSPVEGKVISVFPTKHAVGLELDNGIEVLVHIGIDTVELEGGPFETFVKDGDYVDQNTVLAEVDLEALAEVGKINTIIVVLTDMNQVSEFKLEKIGEINHSEEVGFVEGK